MAIGWATAVLLAVLSPAQCLADGGLATPVTSTVARAATALKPTAASAAAASVQVTAPAVSVKVTTPSVSVKAGVPAVSVKATAPAVSLTPAAPAVSVKATVPAVVVSATVPAVNVKAAVPPVDVKATSPAASVTAGAPAVSVKASPPAVSVNTAHAPSGPPGASAPAVTLKTSAARPAEGAVPAVAVGLPGRSAVNITAPAALGAASRRDVAATAAAVNHDGPSASATAASLSDDSSAIIADGTATSFGQRPFSGYATPNGGASPRTGDETAAHQRLGQREARAIIAGLAGCLATLPRRQRLLLELLSGVDTPRALTLDQVAAALHVPSAKVPRLERTALARLRSLARTSACGRTTQSVPTMELASYTVAAVPGSVEAARGGVKGARYAKAPSGGSASSKAESGHFELAAIPASHTGALLLLIATLAAALAIVALSIDAVGAGPRNRRWRARWLAGTRQSWRRRRRR